MDAFVWPVRVYYEDTDAGGLVYHANYLKFMERARTEWLRSLGFEQNALMRELDTMFAVRAMQIDFLKPARFDDALEVLTRIEACRGASLLFAQSIHRADAGRELLCSARVKVACLDSRSLKPRPIPNKIKLEITDVG